MKRFLLGAFFFASCTHRSAWMTDESSRITQAMAPGPEAATLIPDASALGPSPPLAEGAGKDASYRIRPGFSRPVAKKRLPRTERQNTSATNL